MNLKDFNDSIKRGEFKQVYLLYGEERYLVNHYADTMVAALCEPDNFDNSASAAAIIMAAENLPFLAEKRLVRVRDSKLFASGRKAESEAMTAYLPKVPDTTVLLFTESEVDRRGRLYKKVAELGGAIECETPTPQALATWLTRIFKEKGKAIDPAARDLLIRNAAHNMTTLAQEAKKLAAYAGQRQTVTTQDVEAICSPTLQTRVFDMIGAMAAGRTAAALDMYHNMLLMKEQPLMILAMIIRQFRILLMVKAASTQHMPKAQMAKTLGLRSFVVDDALSQNQRFTIQQLFKALSGCQETDTKIKSGRINAEIGVELLILQY
ncbi:MAG: DNA polymerase III subunit delta [Defluviitaleaceae bacterium]|nr:DNA polymerase III subunit delta [Defluviitaleaceae bacterium]